MTSPCFTSEHELFRQSVREFVTREIVPHVDDWEKQRRIPREIWKRLGELGFLGINHDEQYGGAGADFFYTVAFLEELARCGSGGFGAAVAVQQYMATAHLARIGSEPLKQRYLVPSIQGDKIGALAISEPDAGSDVAAIRTTAVRQGDHYVINGSKMFITNGLYGDFVTVAVKTKVDAGVSGISLIIVDTETPGVTSKKLEKMGWHCSDTADLAFDEAQVPASNLIGEENQGFFYIMESFQLERLTGAILSLGGAQFCMEITLKHVRERQAFGRPLAKFQVIRHTLAELAAELEAARQLTYHTAWLHDRDEPAVQQCSMTKLITTELAKKVADACLQYFGGYGYMEEYLISRAYRDARVGTIAGGASEIMREIIAKMMIDEVQYQSGYSAPQPPTVDSNKTDDDSTRDERATPSTVAEIFAGLPQRFRADKAAGWQSVFHFQITGEGGGEYTVRIDESECQVESGLTGEPNCVIATEVPTFMAIELGKSDPQVALMMGKVKVSNISALLQFGRVFKRLVPG